MTQEFDPLAFSRTPNETWSNADMVADGLNQSLMALAITGAGDEYLATFGEHAEGLDPRALQWAITECDRVPGEMKQALFVESARNVVKLLADDSPDVYGTASGSEEERKAERDSWWWSGWFAGPAVMLDMGAWAESNADRLEAGS